MARGCQEHAGNDLVTCISNDWRMSSASAYFQILMLHQNIIYFVHLSISPLPVRNSIGKQGQYLFYLGGCRKSFGVGS